MDDLDRLYHRLVLGARDAAPHLLTSAFRLGDVATQLVPYRHTRRELGYESIQQYETALLRLAAGERGYLRATPTLQEAARRALAAPQPDGAVLQAHAESPVSLPPDAVALAGLDARSDAAGDAGLPIRQAGADSPAVPPGPSPAGHRSRTTGETGAIPAAADLERAVVASSLAADAWSDLPRPSAARRETAPAPSAGGARPPRPDADGHRPCRYCGQPLPDGRRITFCPYCGNNVTVLQCPACSTELEVGWRFCITCGRTMDDAGLGPVGGPSGGGGAP